MYLQELLKNPHFDDDVGIAVRYARTYDNSGRFARSGKKKSKHPRMPVLGLPEDAPPSPEEEKEDGCAKEGEEGDGEEEGQMGAAEDEDGSGGSGQSERSSCSADGSEEEVSGSEEISGSEGDNIPEEGEEGDTIPQQREIEKEKEKKRYSRGGGQQKKKRRSGVRKGGKEKRKVSEVSEEGEIPPVDPDENPPQPHKRGAVVKVEKKAKPVGARVHALEVEKQKIKQEIESGIRDQHGHLKPGFESDLPADGHHHHIKGSIAPEKSLVELEEEERIALENQKLEEIAERERREELVAEEEEKRRKEILEEEDRERLSETLQLYLMKKEMGGDPRVAGFVAGSAGEKRAQTAPSQGHGHGHGYLLATKLPMRNLAKSSKKITKKFQKNLQKISKNFKKISKNFQKISKKFPIGIL